jgi:hypothetical protein
MSRSRLLGRVRSVLSRVVAPALLVDLLCAGDPSLSCGDADDGYQWEEQTSKGWIPYWDPSQV